MWKSPKLWIGLLLFLAVVAGGGMALLTSYKLEQAGTEPIAPTAPKSRPKAAARQIQQTATLEKFPGAKCPWNQGDNMSKKDGYARARVEKTVSINPTDCAGTATLDQLTITAPASGDYLFDDSLVILLDGKVLGEPNTFTKAQALGTNWSWGNVKNTRQYSTRQNTEFVCFTGEICQVPRTRKSQSGGSKGAVNISLSAVALDRIIDRNAQNHSLTVAVVGDNNPGTDCQLRENMSIALTYTCNEVQLPPPSPSPLPSPAPSASVNPSISPSPAASIQPSPSPSASALPSSLPSSLPSPSLQPSPSPSPAQLAACRESCSDDMDCEGVLVCASNRCVNPQCTSDSDCVCSIGGPASTPTPSPSQVPSPSPELASCRDGCDVDIDCAGSLICVNDTCVNPQCTSDADCVCSVGGPVRTPAPTPEEIEEVELPEAGVSLPTLGILGAGLTTLILGMLVLVW